MESLHVVLIFFFIRLSLSLSLTKVDDGTFIIFCGAISPRRSRLWEKEDEREKKKTAQPTEEREKKRTAEEETRLVVAFNTTCSRSRLRVARCVNAFLFTSRRSNLKMRFASSRARELGARRFAFCGWKSGLRSLCRKNVEHPAAENGSIFRSREGLVARRAMFLRKHDRDW